MVQLRHWGAPWALCLILVACDGDASGSRHCEPGQLAACECSGEVDLGWMLCSASGDSFGDCRCGGTSPCDEVDCSGHGTCAIVGSTATCICDTGYRREGVQCIPGEPGDLCGGVECGEHSLCAQVAGEARCVCDDGYYREDGRCSLVTGSDCEGVSCSGHGVCAITRAGATCACDPGFHPVGLSCLENDDANPCAGVTCSGYGTCDPGGGHATCLCVQGYHSIGADCVEDDIIPVSRSVDKIIADPNRPYLYAGSRGSGYLLIINRDTRMEEAAIYALVDVSDIDLDAEAGILYAISMRTYRIARYDVVNRTFLPPIVFDPPADHTSGAFYRVAPGRTGRVFFADAAWSPQLHQMDTDSGEHVSTDGLNGVGDVAASSDGHTLYTWTKLGWSAGSVNSFVRRIDARSDALTDIEVGSVNVRRDPLDGPLLLAEGRLAVKHHVLLRDDLNYVVDYLPDPIYGFTLDGEIAITATHAYRIGGARIVRPLTVTTRIMATSPDASEVYLYDAARNAVVVQSLAGL
jgi:hypothetical protein